MYIIHVNQYVIKFNAKYNTNLPPYRVQVGRNDPKPRYAMKVLWNGPSETVYAPHNPLKCGAKIWIETESELTLVGECFYSNINDEMEKIKNQADH